MYTTFTSPTSGAIIPFPLDAYCVAYCCIETPAGLYIAQALKMVGESTAQALARAQGSKDLSAALRSLGGGKFDWVPVEGAVTIPEDKGAVQEYATLRIPYVERDGVSIPALDPDSELVRHLNSPVVQGTVALPGQSKEDAISILTGVAAKAAKK